MLTADACAAIVDNYVTARLCSAACSRSIDDWRRRPYVRVEQASGDWVIKRVYDPAHSIFLPVSSQRPQYLENAHYAMDYLELYRSGPLDRRVDVRPGARPWEESRHLGRAVSLRSTARVDAVHIGDATAAQRLAGC